MEINPFVALPKLLVSFKKILYLDAPSLREIYICVYLFLFVVKNILESRPTTKIYEKSPTHVIHVGVINVPYIHIDPFGGFGPFINLLPSRPDLGEDLMFFFLFFVLCSEQLTWHI